MSINVRILQSLHDIAQADWDGCAMTPETGHNPFMSYDFLMALEESGSATINTGWLGQHAVMEDESGKVLAVMPLYLKNHSQGEYVFDHSWANALHQAGGQYYPKFQSSVPFSPVTGSRLMVRPDCENPDDIRRAMLKTVTDYALEKGASSLHITFMPEEEWRLAGDMGLLQRQDQQFHWLNKGYRSFEEFLNSLSSRKRKNIRKERRVALENDIEIDVLTRDQITESHWDDYFSFYLDTSNRKWGQAYLNRAFFSELGARMADKCVLIMCRRNGRYIAGALNLLSDDTLYGRYWGCIEDHRCLHFEVCYYQAIDYAIQHGLKKVEAGAQGEHKLARGYLPTKTFSAHWINNPSFRQAVADYLIREHRAIDDNIEFLGTFSPFKKS